MPTMMILSPSEIPPLSSRQRQVCGLAGSRTDDILNLDFSGLGVDDAVILLVTNIS
jgi:hypothetical protein